MPRDWFGQGKKTVAAVPLFECNAAAVRRAPGPLAQQRKRYPKKPFGKFSFKPRWANHYLREQDRASSV